MDINGTLTIYDQIYITGKRSESAEDIYIGPNALFSLTKVSVCNLIFIIIIKLFATQASTEPKTISLLYVEKMVINGGRLETPGRVA